MVKDKESLKDYWRRNADEIADAVRSGKKVVYLTVGDPALYSTWIYIHRELRRTTMTLKLKLFPALRQCLPLLQRPRSA